MIIVTGLTIPGPYAGCPVWKFSSTTLRNQNRLKKFSAGYVPNPMISGLTINLKGNENIYA